MSGPSPFLDLPSSGWVAQNRSAVAVSDAHPVTDGHTLVVPRRLISSWWEASDDERLDLLALVSEVKCLLDESHAPDGFNVGFNLGAAAGQTIEHFHIHVIPRRWGDVDDPRGGVRAVVPQMRAWEGMPDLPDDMAAEVEEVSIIRRRTFALIAGPDHHLHPELVRCLSDQAFDRVDVLASFIMRSGLDLLAGGIEDALDRGAQVRVLTTDYLGITERSALGWLLDRMSPTDSARAVGIPGVDASEDLDDGVSARRSPPGSLVVRVFSDTTLSFHPKSYIFWASGGQSGVGFVGSSNLSRSGLSSGIEWNMRTDEVPLLRAGFDRLWEDRRSRLLDEGWLAGYRARGQSARIDSGDGDGPHVRAGEGQWSESAPLVDTGVDPDDGDNPTPTPIQREALDALEATRASGFGAGLVVMATGLGKTWLAAFDSTRPGTRRVLFVAHREEILRQARDVFRRVRPDATVGLYLQGEKHHDADVVFAGVQSLVRNLDGFDRDAFDYVVVDEFHHAAARSYRRVIDHFLPKFLLGLTATPERFDGADLLSLCHDNLPFEWVGRGHRSRRAGSLPVLGSP